MAEYKPGYNSLSDQTFGEASGVEIGYIWIEIGYSHAKYNRDGITKDTTCYIQRKKINNDIYNKKPYAMSTHREVRAGAENGDKTMVIMGDYHNGSDGRLSLPLSIED